MDNENNGWQTIETPYQKNDEQYVEFDKKKGLNLKLLKWLALVILVIVVILLFLKACGNKNDDLEQSLLDAGKIYYQTEQEPAISGSCYTVSLQQLIDKKLLDVNKYKSCSKDETIVKVCLLLSAKLHYVPILKCGNKEVDELYNDWQKGTEDDITPDNTDIKFLFLGQKVDKDNLTYGKVMTVWENEIPFDNYEKISSIPYYQYRTLQYKWISTSSLKQYYPNNKKLASNVKEYYVSSPANGYTNKDNATSKAYKWYKETTKKSSTSPGNGYEKKTEANYIDGFSATKPSEQDYRTYISSRQLTAYRSRSISDARVQYRCSNTTSSTSILNSNIPCNQRTDSFKIDKGTSYKCTTGTLDETKCLGQWSSWSLTKCVSTSTLDCYSQKLWYYRDRTWIWAKKNYYPSGSTKASLEKTYYISSPAKGYIKDNSTVTKAYKWYKKITNGTITYSETQPFVGAVKSGESSWSSWTNWSTTKVTATDTRQVNKKNKLKIKEILVNNLKWIDVTDGYVSEENLILAFQKQGYGVASLQSIQNKGDIRYQMQLYYRDKK